MKTTELIGRALDWAVERANGTHWSENGYFCFKDPERYDSNPELAYSTGAAGDGIIDREKISTRYIDYDVDSTDDCHEPELYWQAWMGKGALYIKGTTRREAAMRAYVISKLGSDVDIPKELM